MKDLKNHQRHIKDNTENYQNQVQLFRNLKMLLEIKRKVATQGGNDGYVGYEDTQARGFDRFVVRE